MKGEDWKFEKFIPDKDDINAECNALNQFIKKLEEHPELHFYTADIFCCGFNRGCAWMKDKMKGE